MAKMADRTLNSPQRALRSRVVRAIRKKPGRTQLEITRALFGKHVLYSRVSAQCRRLIREGIVYEKGKGGKSDPLRYYPVIGGDAGERSSDSEDLRIENATPDTPPKRTER